MLASADTLTAEFLAPPLRTAASGSRASPHRAGTRALQRLLECVRGEQAEHLIAAALAPRVDELIKDLHANHVIQRCVATLTGGRNSFVLEAVAANLVEIGTHRHGCCVLQRCLDNATGTTKEQLVSRVIEHTRSLIADQFGNYGQCAVQGGTVRRAGSEEDGRGYGPGCD